MKTTKSAVSKIFVNTRNYYLINEVWSDWKLDTDVTEENRPFEQIRCSNGVG